MTGITTPPAHQKIWLQWATLRLAAYLTAVGGGSILDRYPFLNSHLEAVRRQLPPRPTLADLDLAWGEAVAKWEAGLPAGADLPLARLRRAGLHSNHLQALMLAGLVELDARFGTVYGVLHPFPDELRLTVGLLDDLLQFNASGREATGWQVARELEERGLLTIHHPDRPRAARPLSVPAAVWDACGGEPIAWEFQPEISTTVTHQQETELTPLAELQGLLPAGILERLGRIPGLAAAGLLTGLMVRGMRGSGRRRALGGVAQAMERDLLHVRCMEPARLPQVCRLAGPMALLLRALPVIELELTPGEAVTLPRLAGYDGLVGLILNPEGSVVGPAAERSVILPLPAPTHQARHQQWCRVLNGRVNGRPELVESISLNYHLTLGGVERTGQLAQLYAALNGREQVELVDVQEAYRTLNRQSLENLATRLEASGDWEDLIIAEATRAELQNLILRCRHRERVLAHLGRAFKGTTRGVRALFSGPSGTGKTLTARIVAAELGLDLYRVELSSVVSKYIGETERNLSQLFARAEEQDIVLLLDEGDSLLTARTDVRNSTDRYANMETNYLLQRLEQYEGIILITSNAADRIDSAFQRRMDVSIEFSVPNVEQRQQLWRLHLPTEHAVSPSFIHTVALRCQMTGGQIRNAALHATVLALETSEPLRDAFLAEGIQREYTKVGAATPLSL